jgi:hypothetical protein
MTLITGMLRLRVTGQITQKKLRKFGLGRKNDGWKTAEFSKKFHKKVENVKRNNSTYILFDFL